MPKQRPWTVLPHGAIEVLEDNLWAVSGSLPHGPMNRRMAIVRRSDGTLVFHNAIPLDEDAMREVAALGRPACLIVPTGYHRLDVAAFRERLGLQVFCPAPVRRQVEARVRVDGVIDALPPDAALTTVPLEGSRTGEAALLVRSAGGERVTLLFGDVVMNVPHAPGLGGLLLRALGTSGGPKVTPIARRFTLRSASALAAHLDRLAATLGLVRLLVSHGVDVTEDAAGVLRGVARRLKGAPDGK